ncbi:sigma-70 family RNA polymerase sigma factor [Gracilibacillus sp. YIM 98692]|uniref:RNA polymerase sigma factor n=1 Tax=Gracilibacillus sp. YIM 98692 TaxID=2663532 RepID=UPI001F093937|nr:sigma-70 family RNA polymerase sigma factor [Gracilibacillus sp. YIM 98692]
MINERNIREGGEHIQEDQLIRRVKAGNNQALRILIERYKHHVFKVTYSVIHDQKEAEDLAQETFIKMMDALPSYQFQGFKTWISRIALHKAIDFKRKKQRQKEDLTSFNQDYQITQCDNVETEVMKKEKIEKVRNAIHRMPKKFHDVIKCYYLEELSYKQIAKKLKVEESTVKMRLFRARKWMKTNWKEDDF